MNQVSFSGETAEMAAASATVAVVDDDRECRQSLEMALGMSHRVMGFSSAEELLKWVRPERAAVIVCDLNMPGMAGIELLAQLRAQNLNHPVVMLTGSGDVPRAVKAFKAGAFDFLEKPCPIEKLEAVIARAEALAAQNEESERETETARSRLATLSGRESEVLDQLIGGLSNKMIAKALGLSPRTVEIYRSKVMSKMKASSLPELISTALRVRPLQRTAQTA